MRVEFIESSGVGVTTIYAGTGFAIFWDTFFHAFFEEKINFRGIILVKSKVVINFGVSNSVIDFDQLSLTWLKFYIVVTIKSTHFQWSVSFGVSFSQKVINPRV